MAKNEKEYWHQDTLDERLREERPDRIGADPAEPRFTDDDGATGIDLDAGDEGNESGAEEAAMRLVDDVPGGVDSEIDSYTGENINQLE